MLEFLRPIVIFDTWLYILLGLVAIFFLRLIWLARRDRSRSIFALERENASIRITRYFAGFMIVLVLMLGVYYLSLVTPTIVPPPPSTATPTPIIALPPTPTPPPLLPTPTPTATAAPTIAPTVALEDTPPPPTPELSQGQPPNCPNPAARISQPGNGAAVIGVMQVLGAAATDNFDYYKFEFQDPASGDWVFVSRFDNPVLNGVLGSWNSDTVPPGQYAFRLVVVDKTGNFPEPCVVQLAVK